METELTPLALLKKTQEIERSLGRTVKSAFGYADRLIDIDILLYDNLFVDQPALKIPHPLIMERDFVIIPLVEIAPDLVHPVTGQNWRIYYGIRNRIFILFKYFQGVFVFSLKNKDSQSVI